MVLGLHHSLNEFQNSLISSLGLLCPFLTFSAREFQAPVPSILEHRNGEIEELLGRLKALHHVLKASFQLRTRDGLAFLTAPTRLAAIIGIVLVLALRPSSRHGVPAFAAHHETAQGEVSTKVGASRTTRTFDQVLPDTLVCGETDQRSVMAAPERDAPCLGLDVARIDRIAQYLGDLPCPDLPVRLILGELGLAFEKSLNFRLRTEETVCVAVQSFAQAFRYGLVWNQQLSMDTVRREFVPDGRVKDPVAFLDACHHLLFDLPPVLLTFQFALGGNDRFNEFAFRRIFK
ncbi:hypothetical protein ABMC89_13500 [Sulfitobacter sp. HNIBRBA3233]